MKLLKKLLILAIGLAGLLCSGSVGAETYGAPSFGPVFVRETGGPSAVTGWNVIFELRLPNSHLADWEIETEALNQTGNGIFEMDPPGVTINQVGTDVVVTVPSRGYASHYRAHFFLTNLGPPYPYSRTAWGSGWTVPGAGFVETGGTLRLVGSRNNNLNQSTYLYQSGLSYEYFYESVTEEFTGIYRYGHTVRTVAPTFDAIPDLIVDDLSPVDFTQGVVARWGHSTHRTIPTDGQIIPDSVWVSRLDGLGALKGYAGFISVDLTAFDLHSLSSAPAYSADNTSTTVTRNIKVVSSLAPLLETNFANGSVDMVGTSIAGGLYDPTAPLTLSGGEDGWTNQPIQIRVTPLVLGGSFDTSLRVGSSWTTSYGGGVASVGSYHSNTPIGGINLLGVLTFGGTAPSNYVSAPVTGQVKIDRTLPTAAMTYDRNTGIFTDASADALSGLSLTRPSKIAFVEGSNAQPPDSEFMLFEDATNIPPGTYRVWVWATDKAGNERKTRVSTNTVIDGKVFITKDTDAGATLHVADCNNTNSIYVETDCETGCTVGANADIIGDSVLTYKLNLINTDTATGATGTFEDILPLGYTVDTLPTWTLSSGSGSITGLSFDLGGIGSGYEGQYRVRGNYTLGTASVIALDITGTTPSYDSVTSTNNVLNNQATFTWIMGAKNGTGESNFANHRIYIKPHIEKVSNWGASLHIKGCSNAQGLVLGSGCDSDCEAGDTGYVQKGDIITYKLSFINPSHYAIRFTNLASQPLDTLPDGVEALEWSHGIGSIGGSETLSSAIALGNSVVHTHSQSSLNNAKLESDKFDASSLIVEANGYINIYIKAKVTGTYDEMTDSNNYLVNRVDSDMAFYDVVQDVNITPYEGATSNYITHKIEPGTTLHKWAYSQTATANNPTTHKAGCPNFSNILVLGTCSGCSAGTARLQKDNVITYALTMDNTKNLHNALALDGTIQGGATPGHATRQKHSDTIPEGMTATPSTLRVYVTDKDGNNVAINDGFTYSTSQTVNENGTNVSREVLTLGSVPIGSVNILTGTGNPAFALSNVDLALAGTQWIFEAELMQYYKEGGHDTNGYSITYLFDASVAGEYDNVTQANNYWVNHFKQDNLQRTHNPEVALETLPEQLVILSNSVVHARVSDAVDTLFTKVAAQNLTQGLSGAQFALYKWEGTNSPTTTEANHMVDTSLLIDTATMPAGQWVRVKENADVATLTDFFVSATSPLGEVDLGKLPTGTYTLIETKAPTGYEIPIGQWILTIDSDKTDSGVSDYKIEFAGKSHSMMPPATARDTSGSEPAYLLINARPFTIGLSGLGGTKGILLVGFVLMTLAGNAYIIYSHKQKKKNKQ